MRRSDREITNLEDILAIMRRCEVCRLALNDGGWPYIVPLSFGMEEWGGCLRLFFHSALEGRKTELLRADPRAAFEMDCSLRLDYDAGRGYCTCYYESVMGRGRVRILEEDEKRHGLDALMRHYHPGQGAWFSTAALPRTLVFALDVEEITGKRKTPRMV